MITVKKKNNNNYYYYYYYHYSPNVTESYSHCNRKNFY